MNWYISKINEEIGILIMPIISLYVFTIGLVVSQWILCTGAKQKKYQNNTSISEKEDIIKQFTKLFQRSTRSAFNGRIWNNIYKYIKTLQKIIYIRFGMLFRCV